MRSFLLIIFDKIPNDLHISVFLEAYSIASKKKLLLPYPSFFLTQKQQEKEGRE